MARASANPGRVARWGGVGLLVVGAGCAAGWLWVRPLLKTASVERRPVTRVTPIESPPVDAREVCRVLALRQTAAAVPPQSDPEESELGMSSGAAQLDNRWNRSRSFVREIRPLLIERCYRCHGPDRQEGGVRFDRPETVFRPTASGTTPVIAGHPTGSEIIARVTADEPTQRMPPEGPPLTPDEVLWLWEWIAEGADWPEDARHWAFVKPQAVPPPPVADAHWSRNVIDDFVAARRDAAGLAPAPEADRATLIRRLSLDLIGLPPTPEEVDLFEADEAPDAYERLVDRLLTSPHFGEKWAIRWLDLARFADTDGFEFDARRTIWLYRDWVIDALNRDMPFDQFTVEQLAGDLLPGAAKSQLVATGFLRNSPVAPDTLTHRYDMLVDRVNTLGATWLGLTFSCAQCHDHKFDPLTQREYYQLYAILNNSIDEVSGTGYAGSVLSAKSPLNGQSATTLVLEERDQPNVTHVKVRGSPFVDGAPVEPGLPGFLHEARCGGNDRLALACWLIDEDNPLTSRVVVNRLWETLFGVGLVRTSDDFGVRGEFPSHPELLDWLAVELQRSGWSTRHLIRLIVTSATYRQSSHRTGELQDLDPQNRLLARGPRVRVDAEILRDIALTASGLLSRRLGGPSVFPWQPPGTSENVEFASFPWRVSTGEDRYRRGLYTHWKRRTLYPSFATFDAPSRTSTCTRRERTTNPLQALVTLNDPVFVEAAVHLAGRMMDESDGSSNSALSRGFRLCVGRRPTAEEISWLQSLYEVERERLAEDVAAAASLLGEDARARAPQRDVASWAACTIVANVLLSLDETVTRE